MPAKNNFHFFLTKSQFFAILFTIFFLPFYNSLTSVGLGLTFLFLIINTFFRNINFRSPSFATILFFIFILFSFTSIFYPTNLAICSKSLKKIFIYFFFYISIIVSINNEKQLKGIVCILLASVMLLSLDGLYQYINGKDWFNLRSLITYPQLEIKRITGSFHQAGSLGIYLGAIVPLILCFSLFYSISKFYKLALYGILLISLCALILTYAPGAIFGIYLAFILIAIIKKNKWLIILLLTGLFIGLYFLPESLISWPNGSLFTSINGRINMWKTTFQIIRMHPFLGGGMYSFPVNYQNYCLPGQPHCGGGAPYAHNMYLQMIAELGLLGLSIFLSLIISTFKKLYVTFRQSSADSFKQNLTLGLMGSLSAYLTHGLLESSIYTSQGALLFWLLIGAAHAATQKH